MWGPQKYTSLESATEAGGGRGSLSHHWFEGPTQFPESPGCMKTLGAILWATGSERPQKKKKNQKQNKTQGPIAALSGIHI